LAQAVISGSGKLWWIVAMLQSLCCKLAPAADTTSEFSGFRPRKLREVIGLGDDFCLHGGALVAYPSFANLREAWVGRTMRVSETPEILVTVADIVLKDGPCFTCADSFTIKALLCEVEIQVQRSTAFHLSGKYARLSDLVSRGEKTITGGLGFARLTLGALAPASADAMESVLDSPKVCRPMDAVRFDVLLDLTKMDGIDDVSAKVVAVTSAHEAITRLMLLSDAEKYVEAAVSQRLSCALAEWRSRSVRVEKGDARHDAFPHNW